jgi:predicted DCC family thiol-disulfide oxidoreductase YuxK
MTGQGLVVWYNTRCPVCDAGIDWQRNKLVTAVRAGTISFKDINEEPDALAACGVSLDDVRRRLHATDEAGRLIVGADVAIAMWRHARRRLARIAVRQPADAAGYTICL